MADLKKTVEIVFGAKNEVSKTVTEIGRNFETLGDLTSKVTAPLAKIGDSILKIDAALLALAIGGMAYAIKTAGEFSGKFSEITTLIDATGAPIDAFRKSILDYSTGSVKSIGDINQAIYNAISAGVSYEKSLEFVTQAEKLAVAGRAGLDATTKVLISTLNAYGASTDQAGKYSDTMFTTVRLGQTTLEELSASLAMVTGLASTSGIPFETLSAAIAALTVAGLPTAQAITGIRQAIQNIIQPSGEAEDAARRLGIKFDDAALKTKGFEGVLQETYRATGGNIGKMGDLFGSVESLNAVMILGADKSGKFKEAMVAMGNAAGATQVAYDKVAGEFENINKRLENSFRVTLIAIGEKLMPEYGKIAGAFGDLMKGIKVGIDAGAFDPLFAYLDRVGASIAEFTKGVAAAMPEALAKIDFEKLIAAFDDLGRAIVDYFGGLDLTKADDLAAAMQLLIDIVTGIVRVTTGMVDAFRPFAAVIVDFFQTLAQGGPETQETIGKILAFSQAIQATGLGVVAAILAIDEFKVSMRGLFDIFAGGAQIMWNGMQILFDLIMRGFLLVEGQLVAFIDTMTFGMFPGLGALRAQITQQTEEVGRAIWKNGMEAGQGLDRMIDGFVRLGTETGTSKTKAEELRKGLLEIPPVTTPKVKLEGAELTKAELDAISLELDRLPEEEIFEITPWMERAKIEEVNGVIKKTFPDGRVEFVNVSAITDVADLLNIKGKIDKAIPGKKEVDVQAKLDKEKLKEQSDIIQKSIEWKAKVDIAEAEASTKKLTVSLGSVNEGFKSTGDQLSNLFGLMNTPASFSSLIAIQDQIKRENDLRQGQFDLQKKLIETQITLEEAKARALQTGSQTIQVQASGLQPHLEMILWEILKAIQIRANASGAEFLLGVK